MLFIRRKLQKISKIRFKNVHKQTISVYAHTFVSIINSNWEICNGTLNNLIDNWCLWVQTQIIGPFWCRFWPGELNIGHYSLVWLLYRVVRLTCCSSAGSFLKHSPHHALYSRLFQSICWLSYANDPLYPDGKWKSFAAEATGRKQWAAWTSEGSGGEQKQGEKTHRGKPKSFHSTKHKLSNRKWRAAGITG